jgi:hypothetical protein
MTRKLYNEFIKTFCIEYDAKVDVAKDWIWLPKDWKPDPKKFEQTITCIKMKDCSPKRLLDWIDENFAPKCSAGTDSNKHEPRVINFLGDIKKMLARKKYVKAMLNAIEYARKNVFDKNLSSKTDALRVIRRFEKVNNCVFNPFDKIHLEYIAGCGTHENFFRAIKLAQKDL